MKTDILIPLGTGSQEDNLELRYCLRSIEKHLKNVGQVLIVGQLPKWVQNVRYVCLQDNHNNWMKANNIYRKILAGCYLDWLSNDFLYVHDDHFLLKDYDAFYFPNYHRGIINLENFKDNQSQYKQMDNTCKALGYIGFDFDVHCPMLLNKDRFKYLFKNLKWEDYGVGIKSYYGNNYADLDTAVETYDKKFNSKVDKRAIYTYLPDSWFSVGDRSLNSDMKEVLQELYPDKSKYEI